MMGEAPKLPDRSGPLVNAGRRTERHGVTERDHQTRLVHGAAMN